MKIRNLLIAGALTAALTLPASALTLNVDGRDRTTEAGTTLINGTTYVSLRTVAAMLDADAQIQWRAGVATVSTSELSLTARPGNQYIQVNGRCLYAKDGVKLIGGSTMVPIRVLAEAMGGSVSWDNDTRTVRLTTGAGVPAPADYNEEDLYWLSRIISAESKGETLLGKIAVGTVVLNRMASDQFPNTIEGVIFDSRWGGQFEPVRNGTVYDTPTEESVIAAKLCLEGARAAGKSLYFLAPNLTQNHWIMENRTYVTTIGCHWFYL